MNKRYKENIEIDENHMLKTIELSKLKLINRQAKYEEDTSVIWLSFFKKESLKFCLLSILITSMLCLLSLWMEIEGYSICSLNAAILSIIVFVDYIQVNICGMDELLFCTKLNPARIFVYKSNVYLFVCLGCSLFLNIVLTDCCEIDFMTALFVSLFPMYLLSGFMLMIIDKIRNKGSLLLIYVCVYVCILFLMNKYINELNLSNTFVLTSVVFSFGIYCYGIYIHARKMNERKGCYVWN